MKTAIKCLLVTLMYTIAHTSFAQTASNPCSIMLEGTFLYGNTKRLHQTIVIKNNIMTEDWGYGKLIITSNITWINDCEYISTVLKVSEPNFKYNVGDRLTVKINKVRGSKIYYSVSKNGYNWDGHLIKQEEE
ncbi:hypothetical protein ACFQ5N_08645 [Lutibacter holmesii]|uniref:DUF3127 domain-containing protein n=1 Tax=Lutibacter holmesii TaxID=1137985 RepID=A0ABW3WRL2_9FLAO